MALLGLALLRSGGEDAKAENLVETNELLTRMCCVGLLTGHRPLPHLGAVWFITNLTNFV
jgi:hypothetical protein